VLSTPPAFILSQDQTLHKKQKATETPWKIREESMIKSWRIKTLETTHGGASFQANVIYPPN
jgi:hypothetical protein